MAKISRFRPLESRLMEASLGFRTGENVREAVKRGNGFVEMAKGRNDFVNR